MPIFRYLCKQCGTVTTKLVPRFDTAVACESCGSGDTVKQPSTIAVASSRSSAHCSHASECAAAASGCGCAGGCCGHRH